MNKKIINDSLRKKYGSNKKSRALYDCAIRNEISGGDELLDLLEFTHKLRRGSKGDERKNIDSIHQELSSRRSELITIIQQEYSNSEIPRFFLALDDPHAKSGNFYVFCREPAILFRGGQNDNLISVDTFFDMPEDSEEADRILSETKSSLLEWFKDYTEQC